MNTAEIIYEKSKALPEPYALEVLDFIGYLEQKKLKASPHLKKRILNKDSVARAIQAKLNR